MDMPEAIASLISGGDYDGAIALCIKLHNKTPARRRDLTTARRKQNIQTIKKNNMQSQSPEPARRDEKMTEDSQEHVLCSMVADLLDLEEYNYNLLSVRIEKILGYGPNATTMRKWRLFKGAPRTKGYPEAIAKIWNAHYY